MWLIGFSIVIFHHQKVLLFVVAFFFLVLIHLRTEIGGTKVRIKDIFPCIDFDKHFDAGEP